MIAALLSLFGLFAGAASMGSKSNAGAQARDSETEPTIEPEQTRVTVIEPEVEPQPEPEPEPEPETESETQPDVEVINTPATLVIEPVPTIAEPAQSPAVEPATSSIEPTIEPRIEPIVAPQQPTVISPEPSPRDDRDHDTEPQAEPEAEPYQEPYQEPVADAPETPAPAEPVEPAPASVQEPTPQLTPEPLVETLEDPLSEPAPAPAAPAIDTPVSVAQPAIPPTPSLTTTDGPERLEPTEVAQGDTLTVDGGRVTTLQLDLGKEISAVEIMADPDHGHATVNPDNTIALVLSGSDYSGPLSVGYKVTYTDGTTEASAINVTATPPSHAAGWGHGKHYLLEEDADGDLIVETGDNHRKLYVSESEEALSRADIAALEGMAEEDVTRQWLAQNGEYGATEDMALKTDVAMDLWFEMTSPHYDIPSSNWLMFEKGYTYEGTGRLVTAKMDGESELHPAHITSWGEGERPIITDRILFGHHESYNIVFSDLHFTGGVLNQTGNDVIFHDVLFSDDAMNIQEGERFTLHDSEVAHVVNDAPEGATIWSGNVAGLYTKEVDGWLIEGTTFHHNGWEDDYHNDWSTEGGMPPNIRSHNVYLQYNTTDVTFRDNITAEGSSFGLHARGGGFIENNLFLDNNNAVDVLGGDYEGSGPIGNFTFFADNVITSGAHKRTDLASGGLTRGVTNDAEMTTLLDNIITHLANPDDPDEIAAKWRTNYALDNKNDPAYDNTIIYNWLGGSSSIERAFGEVDDRVPTGFDEAAANDTTIQNFAAQLLGVPEASIRDLMDYILSLPESEFDDAVTATDIINYFQAGFGLTTGDEAQTDHRFIPNDLGDGVRWDNRINWDTEDVPDDGDNVALAGNHVQYGGTTTINDLDLGTSGELHVNYGKLTVEGELSVGARGGEITTHGAGQFWTDGYSDTEGLELNVTSGRFANTGDFTGKAAIHASGDGQAILATDGAMMELGDGSELRLEGSETKVGFDGENNGIATLEMAEDATLSFVADAEGFATLGEFRSGKWADQEEAEVQSGISLDGTLNIDLSAYAGGTGTHTLAEADALDGIMDDIHVYGLANNLDAEVRIDYDADQLLLEISSGSGQISFDSIGTAGTQGSASNALWAALTDGQGTYDDNLPALHDEDNAELSDIILG